uniref:Photosystem I assembly protein Ycf4 n=1 Tax=Selaginella uncinata TaxID=307165 RepID=A0A0G2UNG4_SELUN|nr:photosystem I assembly protein Ycf4 [Selaginella uncinata]
MDQQSEWLRVEPIEGSRRVGNLFWACTTLPGALGFFLVGISSYLDRDLTPLLPSSQLIPFVPQGIVMCFYGISGLFLSLYLWCTILWSVGSGCDRYDKQGGMISLLRWGFPGETRRIYTRFPLEYVQAIRMEEGIDSRYVLCMRMEGGQQQNVLPIRAGEYSTPRDMEREAAELARFLDVSIEGLDEGG